jgi:hypothetical protein
MRRLALASLLIGSGLACRSEDSTQLVVTVWSDLASPAEMNGVRLDVSSASDGKHLTFPVSGKTAAGTAQLVARVAFVPLSAKNETIDIKATATLDRTDVVSQAARLPFVPGQAHELTLFLGRSCIGHDSCDSSFTCANGACTCANGACTQPIDVATTALPAYVPGKAPTRPDAGTADATVLSAIDGTSPDTSGGASQETNGAAEAALESPLTGDDGRGPDSALPDAVPDAAAEPDAAVPLDDASPTDSQTDRPLLKDSAPDGADLAPEVKCAATCTLKATECGPNGLRTCVVGSDGCATWGPEMPCGGRKTCSAGSASCACPAAPSTCANGQGSFCSTADGTLQTCLKDSDGCVFLGAPTTCPAQKPCTGSYPSANCSCPAAPAICQNTVGTFCDTTANAVVTCSRDSQGCLVAATTKTCTATKACGGLPGSADCTCPTVVACEGSQANSSYCSNTDVVTCAANGEGCQTATTALCPAGKPCKMTGTVPACTCPTPPAACLDGSGTFVTGPSCDTNGQVVTCGLDSTSGCPVALSTTPCSSPATCQGAKGSASCQCPSVPECTSQPNGSYCSTSSLLIQCADKNGCQEATQQQCNGTTPYCIGTYPTATCVGEQTIGNYTDLGFPSSPSSLSSGTVFGWPITVTANATLQRFGAIYHGPLSGPADSVATFALYTSSSTNTSTAIPVKLVAASVQHTLKTSNGGRNEFAVDSPPTPVTLAPGVYWVMITFNQNTYLDQDQATTAPMRYFSLVWGNPLPATLTAAQVNLTTRMNENVYVVILPQ